MTDKPFISKATIYFLAYVISTSGFIYASWDVAFPKVRDDAKEFVAEQLMVASEKVRPKGRETVVNESLPNSVTIGKVTKKELSESYYPPKKAMPPAIDIGRLAEYKASIENVNGGYSDEDREEMRKMFEAYNKN